MYELFSADADEMNFMRAGNNIVEKMPLKHSWNISQSTGNIDLKTSS